MDDKQSTEQKIVIFTLNKEYYGIEISKVKEIIKASDYTSVPNAPEYVLGLLDLRGEVIVIFDLARKFGLNEELTQKKDVIVCETTAGKIGIEVDKVYEITTVGSDQIKEPEKIVKQKISEEFLQGVLIYQKKVLVILDVDHLLEEVEFNKNNQKNLKNLMEDHSTVAAQPKQE